MYTCIIHREEYDIWVADSDCRTSPSRMEIVYSEGLAGLEVKLLEASKLFWDDVENLDAEYPSYIMLYNGVPSDHLDEELSDKMLEVTRTVAGQMTPYLTRLRQIKVEKEKQEKLDLERLAKSRIEINERNELARLMAKYGE